MSRAPGLKLDSVLHLVSESRASASFNENIGAWDTSGVTRTEFMFYSASAFDQDLGWCVDDGAFTYLMFDGAACTLPSCNVTFGGCPP